MLLWCFLQNIYAQQTIAEFDKASKILQEKIEENTTPEKLKKLYTIAEKLDYKNGARQVLYLYAQYHLEKQNYDSSILYLNKILNQFKTTDNDTIWGDVFFNFGSAYLYKGETDSSKIYYTKAKEFYKAKNNYKKINNCLNNLGILSAQTGALNEAANYFDEALLNSIQLKDSSGMLNGYNNLALVYGILKNYKATEENLLKVLNIAKASNDNRGIFRAYLNLGTNSVEQHKFEESLAHYKEAYKYCNPSEDKYNYALLLTNHGRVLMDLKQYNEAEKLFLESLAIKKELNSINGMEVLCLNLASIAESKKDFQKALKFLEDCEQLEQTSNNMLTQINAKHLYTQIFIQQNKTDKALAAFKEYVRLKDEYFSKEQAESVQEIETKYKLKDVEYEKELALQSALIEAQKKKQYFIILIAVIIAVCLGAVFIYLLYQKRKKDEELKQKIQLAATIYDTEEKEKSRIARDLHDGIVQDLTAFKIDLSLLEQYSSEEKKAKLIQEITKITNEVRELSYRMMPVTLQELGLEKALNELLNRSFATNNIAFEINIFGILERLPERVETTVYRICQELINNTLKHSKADNVSLLLQIKNNILQITYEDNGIGFDTQKIQKGIGLNSLNNRIKMLEGTLEFDNNTTTGTTAFIRIPL
ncbi:MAG: tetratricopeptide repeat protein [Bacteroidetes bacterium]|nr:tetratricopeptide repeat protein [Bacteroidota bacterium]